MVKILQLLYIKMRLIWPVDGWHYFRVYLFSLRIRVGPSRINFSLSKHVNSQNRYYAIYRSNLNQIFGTYVTKNKMFNP